MSHHILQRFTNNFKKALTEAKILATELRQPEINPEHLLYGLLIQRGSLGAEILIKAKADKEELKKLISELAGPKIIEPATKLSADSRQVIKKAVLTAYASLHPYVGSEHLLAGLIQSRSANLITVLRQSKIDLDFLSQQVFATLKSTSKFPDLTESFTENLDAENLTKEKENKALEFFGTNLTSEKAQQKIDPVIGREEEITRLIQILCRRHKNNPLLLGDPGVGKTAIIEGLAKKILNHEVPDILLNKKIYTLDLGSTVAGTMYRGEFENRLKQIIAEAKADPNIIIFIDEIHTLVGAGSASGSLDAANLFKPALARGEIRVIGATTLEESRKYIENDAALERRFQTIIVNEPSAAKTKEILQGIKKFYEQFHQVQIMPSAIEAAVKLSERYLPEKFLPDKAIDLIDEAAASLKLKQPNNPAQKELRRLAKNLTELKIKISKALLADDFTLAKTLKTEQAVLVHQQVTLSKNSGRDLTKNLGQITDQDIAILVAKITNIPLTNLLISTKKKFTNLAKELSTEIIGQTEAITAVAEFMRRAEAGLASHNRPIASFLFLGPSGVGKTELAKVMAKKLFATAGGNLSDREAFVRIDMSEYHESFNISKLIGAPAGYVGYKESGKLTESVKRRPYSLVLFDEIEKAHPDVFNLLLQILEDGHLTDATGKKINFKNTIIVLTSNLGTAQLRQKDIGFNSKKSSLLKEDFMQAKEQIITELENTLRPEFLNRLDKIIVFNPLSNLDLIKIAQLQLAELAHKLNEQKIKLKYSPEIAKFIAKKSFLTNQGARAIRQKISDLIANPLAERLLNNKYPAGQTLQLTLKSGKIHLAN
ncbi:MAG: ATP-dependent Clp protease ATP-binding subunit [Candidatus Buchananbacteria bacterium]